jgi:hypothetical protein
MKISKETKTLVTLLGGAVFGVVIVFTLVFLTFAWLLKDVTLEGIGKAAGEATTEIRRGFEQGSDR